MSAFDTLMGTSMLYGGAMMITREEMDKKDDEDIERYVDEYFNETPKLPRKKKKARRKRLNELYGMIQGLRAWRESDPFMNSMNELFK